MAKLMKAAGTVGGEIVSAGGNATAVLYERRGSVTA